ncbi:glycosyltransferase family 39 protein [Candidatus Woesebacteria bacterium]|nr:glycosyltransferase family 39 protein [Candidatus Woesebacteria bacterium]
MEKITIFILILLAPLFFYNLGGYSLVDFDEAWYGEISRNILAGGNPFILTFNDKSYLDHPPLGFILMAASQLLFGSNEFGVRFPSALLGFGSVILTYLVARTLFGNVVGMSSMLVLTSSVWFILRSRQGDLDTILLFFYLLTIYLALQVKKNTNYIYAVSASAALLLSTKSFFGITVLGALIAVFLVNKIKIPIKKVLFSVLIFLIITGAWLIPNYLVYKMDFVN